MRVRARLTLAPLLVAAGAGLLLAASPAAAVPDCASQPPVRVIAEDQGRLESIVSDAAGRLYYTDLTDDRLLRVDGPGQEPTVLSEDIPRPGGLAFDADGSLVAGFSGGPLSGVPENGQAGLLRIDPATGAKKTFVRGLDQANGLVRGPDGSFYTSNNIGGEIARVLPDRSVDEEYAELESPNGLVIGAKGRYLFAAETFRPAKISRVDLSHPSRVTTYFEASPSDAAAGLDGLTRDATARLFVVANGAGEVWRVGTDGQACALVRDLQSPSNVFFGGGRPGFARRSLFVVTFGGQVVELANATNRPPAPPAGSPGGEPRGGQANCRGVEATIVGTRKADVLRGTRRRDVIVGRRGRDEINGRESRDIVCGRRGRDQIRGGGGRDELRGGKAGDHLLGGRAADELSGGRGLDRCRGGRGTDRSRGCER